MSAGRGALSRPSPAGRPLTVLELGLGLGTEPAAAILTQPSLLLCQQGCRLCRDGAPGPPGCARTGATSTRRAGAPLPPPPSTLGEAGRAAPGTHLGAAARGARLPHAHHHQRVLVLLTLVCHTPVPRVRPGLARLPGGPGPRGERPSPRRPPPAATGTASVRPTVPPSPACGFQRVHWASARSMPCNGSAPGSPLPQDLAGSAPCCMAGAPTGRGGRGPEWGGAWGCWGGLLALPRTRPQALRPLAGAAAALTWKRRTELSLPFVTQATCTHRPQHCPSSARYSKPCGGGEA